MNKIDTQALQDAYFQWREKSLIQVDKFLAWVGALKNKAVLRFPQLEFLNSLTPERWKKIGWISLAMLICLLSFYIGLRNNFPGQTLSRVLATQVSGIMPMAVKIEPFEFSGNSIHSARFIINSPPEFSHLLRDFFILEDVNVPLLPGLLTGTLKISASGYDGQWLAKLGVIQQQEFALGVQNVTLEKIPALSVFPYAFFKGQASILAYLENLAELSSGQTTVPRGRLTARLENVSVRTKSLEDLLAGLNIPELKFSEILIDLEALDETRLHVIQFKGSLNGTVKGKMMINAQRFTSSSANLSVSLQIEEAVLKELSLISTFINPYMCKDVLQFNWNGQFDTFQMPEKIPCN